jgi:hypothetical protein
VQSVAQDLFGAQCAAANTSRFSAPLRLSSMSSLLRF